MEEVGNEGFERLIHLYKEAIKARCYIYDKSENKWYTPEEFREKYDTGKLSHWKITRILECMCIRDAVAGINASKKQSLDKFERFKSEMEADLTKQAEFAIKVIQYYQKNK